jgi:hypothetical protein
VARVEPQAAHVQIGDARADARSVDVSAYAFAHGVRHTRATLSAWQRDPAAVVWRWTAGSLLAALGLLVAVWIVASLDVRHVFISLRPPFVVGGWSDALSVLQRNLLVLALHAMACVAGFIAGSSLPLQAAGRRGASRWVHEHGGRVAIGFVVAATTFSLSTQAYLVGRALGAVSGYVHVAPGLLLLSVLPHALPELVALFLPLAAWIIASRRGQWEQLLAATLVTVALALPVLVASAAVEVYVSPHIFSAITGVDAQGWSPPGSRRHADGARPLRRAGLKDHAPVASNLRPVAIRSTSLHHRRGGRGHVLYFV